MSRQWIKLHVCILNDPKVIRLAPAMRWHFVALMAAAGEVDKDGLIGEPEDVAVRLRVSDEELAQIVSSLGKKIKTDKKGMLWVADWKDWQSPRDRTNAERQARHRNAKRNGVTNGQVTALELELEPDKEPEREQNNTPHPPAVAPASANGSTPQTAGREGQGKPVSTSKAKPSKAPRAQKPRDVLFDAWCNVQGFDPDNPGGKAGLARQFSARCERLSPRPTPADVTRFVEREKARLVDGAPAWGTVTKSNTFSDTFVGWWQSGAPPLRLVPKNGRDASPPADNGPDDWGWGTEPIPADPTLQEAAL